MGPLEQFLWGLAGSLSVEVISLSRVLSSGKPLPRQCRSKGYWLIRTLVAVVAGLLAVAGQVQMPFLAMQIGVATPLIIDSWGRRYPRHLPRE